MDIDIEYLKKLYIEEKLERLEICNILNINMSKLNNTLTKYKIKRHISDITKCPELGDKIKELYLGENRTSIKNIATILNIKYSTVALYIHKHNLSRTNIGDTRKKVIPYKKLYDLFVTKKMTTPEISLILNISTLTIQRHLNRYNIKKYDNINENDVCDLYVNKIKSTLQIANILNIPASRVRLILLKNNVLMRNKSTCLCCNNINNDYFDFDFSIINKANNIKSRCKTYFRNHIAKDKKKIINKCEICGTTENLHVHHIIPILQIISTIISENKNKTEDELYNIVINDKRFLDLSNLKVVCKNCHYTIYHPYFNYHVNQQPSLLEGSTTIESIG